VVALLPGSRRKEIQRHLPAMLEAVQRLREGGGEISAVLPVASTIDGAWVARMVQASGVAVTVLPGQSRQALIACDAAMVCSGTATLEAALLGRPMVVVYRVSFLSYHILRRLISVAHIALVNLIAQKRLVPELVQGEMTPEGIARHLAPFLEPGPVQQGLMGSLKELRHLLGYKKPSRAVARAIMAYLPAPSNNGVNHG
jgi:lipid-A-disaccharide synthase